MTKSKPNCIDSLFNSICSPFSGPSKKTNEKNTVDRDIETDNLSKFLGNLFCCVASRKNNNNKAPSTTPLNIHINVKDKPTSRASEQRPKVPVVLNVKHRSLWV